MENTEQLRSTIEFMLGNMELMRKQVELNAALTRIAYDSLQRAGFSEEQATRTNALIIEGINV